MFAQSRLLSRIAFLAALSMTCSQHQRLLGETSELTCHCDSAGDYQSGRYGKSVLVHDRP